MKNLRNTWYLVAFAVTCGIGLAAEATETTTHGAGAKTLLALGWVAAVVAWTTVVFVVSGRIADGRARPS